jgi:hypothetical protein
VLDHSALNTRMLRGIQGLFLMRPNVITIEQHRPPHWGADVCPRVSSVIDRMIETGNLSVNALAVGFAIAWLARQDGEPVELSHPEMMKRVGMRSEHTLRSAITELERARLLKIDRRAGKPAVYALVTEAAHV